MRLRFYRSSDFSALCEIDVACFPPGIAYSRQEMAGYIATRSSRTWVAEEDGTVIGFLIAKVRGQEGHIITVDVVRGWRRRGIATALMAAAEEWARNRGAALVSLETAENNLPAQRFYRARGYEKVDEIGSYYSNGAAAWIMVKHLDRGASKRERLAGRFSARSGGEG